ncbi:MAG: ThiF family adenylyltransferase [Clostridia bacterium]|nr:ThiF family adenylyltransferase [Clostridia bacterium]
MEIERLRSARVAVAGCGGIGGFVVEYLLRQGVGALRVADGDVFDESNLNRQLYSSPASLGEKKVFEAERRARLLRPDMSFEAIDAFLDDENAGAFVSGCDLAIDALDNPDARICLARACAREDVPLIHGAISGWALQLAVISPGSGDIERIYSSGADKTDSSLSFVPPLCAALEAAEAVKLLCCPERALAGRLLCVDILENTQMIIEL